MLYKLLVSVALSLPAAAALHPTELGLGGVLVAVLVAGYHRNLVEPGGRLRWLRVGIPDRDGLYVRYSLWGLPLAPARRVRVTARARDRSATAPIRTRIVECLPAVLRWLVRRAGA